MPPWSRRPARLLLTGLLLTGLLLLGLVGGAAADDERDLEPRPGLIVFDDPRDGDRDLATQREIEASIGRAFASLGDVVAGRELLVKRFGLVCVPALDAVLNKNNQTETWNAALTAGALRDTYGPALEVKALLRPLLRVLTGASSPHDRAFAAIALGCFHGADTEVPWIHEQRAGWYAAVPGPQLELERASRALVEARRELVRLGNGDTAFMRASALLALAKMGGAETQAAHRARALDPFANPTPHRADLLTRAFLGASDEKPFHDGLREEETSIRASAALAVAVSLLTEDRADWTRDIAAVLKPLKSVRIKPHLPDGVEAVFARGVCALQNQANDEWEELWKLATLDRTERDVAEAAAQILNFCDMPWFRKRVVTWAAAPPVELKPPVLAMVLLRAGEQGTPEAIGALLEWLRSRSKRPVPTARWDPRWYAAVGLLRALHAGRIRPGSDRLRVVDALRRSAGQIMDRKAPFREKLGELLDAHGERLVTAKETVLYRLPQSALERIERSFTCPHGLMVRDATDACVLRVNAMVQDIFGLNGIIPWKPGDPQKQQMPERFLKRYLDNYPYFSRLEFRTHRGARPYPRLEAGAEGMDR